MKIPSQASQPHPSPPPAQHPPQQQAQQQGPPPAPQQPQVVAPTMEELAPSQGNHHNGGGGGGASGGQAAGLGSVAVGSVGVGLPGPSPQGGGGSLLNKPNNHDEGVQRTQYSIPGILHFIQHEWARFEMERSQWEVERAELQARIAFLQGERKGQENLKNDLIRRIKMLEYALKQERAKYHKLKYGTELQQGDMKPAGFDDSEQPMDGESPITSVSNVTWRQGRQLLRQYLQEIGYTDTIIDVRSNRVRSLLGLNNNTENEENQNNTPGIINGNESTNKRAGDNQGRRTPAKKTQPSSLAEAMMLDAEAAVMANFEFLSQTVVEVDDEDEMSDDPEESAEEEVAAAAAAAEEAKKRKGIAGKGVGVGGMSNEGMADDVDEEAEEVLNEFNFLGSEGDDSVHDGRMEGDRTNWGLSSASGLPFASGSRHPLVGEEEGLDATLGLGELAQLTVNNEAEISYDQISASKEAFRKTWNAKYTLRSHFDGVRALAFHPVEPVLISASEDHTLKLWNLHKTVPAKKSASLDVEPLYTFRAHVGAVLCLAMNGSGEQCYSGGVDGAIQCWNIPSSSVDPYDSFDPGVLTATLSGHQDAVWGLSIHSHKMHLLSCSADGTVRLWAPQSKTPLLSTYAAEQEGIPTSVDFVREEPNHMVTSYNSSHCIIYDLETGKPVTCLESSQESDNNVSGHQINRVVSHPTLPVTITAHEDRHIRFFDNISGKMVHSMVAHLDAVTSLAVDPNGLYLLSGSHDCSIRLWNLENKTCVQEITAHRKKFEESIFDVAFHPSKPYIASAGADGLAKVFV